MIAAVLVCACGEPPPPLTLTASEVDSPAGADSGEPFLSTEGDTVLMSWLGRSAGGSRRLLFSRYVDRAWEAPVDVAERDRFMVNVADVPSVTTGADGTLWTHWLERDPEGFGYGVRVSRSADGGATWSEPWTLHEDRSAVEHGFVSTVQLGAGLGFVWLDGRGFAAPPDGSAPRMETGLYFRTVTPDGAAGPETPIDVRVCDCCQTDVAVTSDGPVAVYRDRSEGEIRDVRLVRYEGGQWSGATLVHEDGWETGACPINGPAVAARGEEVTVAWFTAADGEARVNVAFSRDAGRSFRSPTRVDGGAPAGRVDVLLLGDGSALVAWVERTGGDGADVRLRRVAPGGERLETLSATARFSPRAIGFPRLAAAGDGAILLAWMDGADVTPRVRVTRIELEAS